MGSLPRRRPSANETDRQERDHRADLVFLAMGFLHPEQEGLIKELRLATDNRDNIAVDNAGYTANSNLFACGDAVSGASLVVKAMPPAVMSPDPSTVSYKPTNFQLSIFNYHVWYNSDIQYTRQSASPA